MNNKLNVFSMYCLNFNIICNLIYNHSLEFIENFVNTLANVTEGIFSYTCIFLKNLAGLIVQLANIICNG